MAIWLRRVQRAPHLFLQDALVEERTEWNNRGNYQPQDFRSRPFTGYDSLNERRNVHDKRDPMDRPHGRGRNRMAAKMLQRHGDENHHDRDVARISGARHDGQITLR